jgi:hypothetical protein
VRLRLSDIGCPAFLGAVLLAIAAYAVFGFQHGFEGQVGWWVTLLPACIVAAAIHDIIEKTVPGVASFAFWAALVSLNFLWYFGISLAAIKIYRFISNASNRS